MRALILAFLVSVALLGDTTPALTWIGDPMINDGGVIFTPDENGINSRAESDNAGFGNAVQYVTYRFFDVTSPGYFTAKSTLMVDMAGDICGGIQYVCGGVSVNASADDFNNNIEGSRSFPGVSDPFEDCEPNGSADCGSVDAIFNDTVISTLFLPVGEYALNQFVTVDGNASGGSFLSVSFQSDITPTPEPRGYAVLLGLTLVGWIARNSDRRTFSALNAPLKLKFGER